VTINDIKQELNLTDFEMCSAPIVRVGGIPMVSL